MPTDGLRLAIEPAWPLPVVLATAAGLTALLWFTYRPRIAHLPPLRRRMLLGLRFAAVAALLFALLRPELRYTETDDSDAVIVILGDASRSMTVPDAAGGQTRRAALLGDLKANEKKLQALGETFEIRYLDFAEAASEPKGGAEAASPEAPGEQTAIGGVLEVLVRSEADKLAGVLLPSDGAQRALPPGDADPRDVARRYGELGVPIYPVPYGGDGGETALDAAVEELAVDPLVFERKAVPVTARVRISGGAGRAFAVRLLVEDRAGKKPGETGELKPAAATDNSRPVREVKTDENNAVLPVELSFVPQFPGEFKVAVEVVPVDGEVKTTNNRRETIVNVQKGGLRVAYFAALGPEQKWIRNVNTEQKIQLDFQAVMPGGVARAKGVGPAWFERGKYDAYILGDVSAAAFGAANARLLAERVNDGAGLMMLGGPRSFGPGGWASTPLAEFLPVEMPPGSVDPENALDPAYHLDQALAMVPTAAGLRHYVMRFDLDDAKTGAAWRGLPPLEGANRIKPRAGGLEQVLAQSEDGQPLLVANEVGRARVMAFAGDTTYLWYTAGHEAEHQRFWRQAILWLTRKELDKDQAVWVFAEPRNAAPGQAVALTYGARNEKGDPLDDAAFEIEVLQPGGGADRPGAPGGAERNTVDYRGTAKPGDYWVRVAASRGGNAVGLDGWTRFLVDSRDLELDNPAADPALLAELAELSGGSVVPPEQLATLLDRWLADPPGKERLTVFRRTPLWDNAFLLMTFVAILGSEWFLRKRFGLV